MFIRLICQHQTGDRASPVVPALICVRVSGQADMRQNHHAVQTNRLPRRCLQMARLTAYLNTTGQDPARKGIYEDEA